MAIFTPDYRDQLRSELMETARKDGRISGGANDRLSLVGLADRWSDIDVAFGIGDASELPETLADWTDLMYGRHEAVHHVDVVSGATVYRVFLLRNSLQVDLAFSPKAEFAARGPAFRLLFGDSVEGRPNFRRILSRTAFLGRGPRGDLGWRRLWCESLSGGTYGLIFSPMSQFTFASLK